MRFLALAVAVALSASSALADHDERRPGRERRTGPQVVVDRKEMASHMRRLERLLEQAYERTERGSGRVKVRRALEELEDMQRALAEAPEAPPVYQPQPQPQPQQPPPPPPAPAVQPIADGRLQQLSAAMARESFPRNKLNVLRGGAPHHYFLVSQLRPLLEQFSFAHDRLEAVRILWPRVLDRENGFHLYEAFPFTNDKQQLRAILNS